LAVERQQRAKGHADGGKDGKEIGFLSVFVCLYFYVCIVQVEVALTMQQTMDDMMHERASDE
jgi:hypothetical protein